MNELRYRSCAVLTIFALCLLVAACGQSTSTSEEAAETDNAQPEAAPNTTRETRYVTLSVPAGTQMEVELLDALSSGTNKVGDPVRARLTGDLFAEGKRVASAGAELRGAVTEVVGLKKFGGQPRISVMFDSLGIDGAAPVAIVAWLDQAGKKQAGRDAAKIAGGAAAGAVVGHQVDDDKGSEIGALVGGAIGTVIAAKTGKEIELAAGTPMLVVLENDAQVRVAE